MFQEHTFATFVPIMQLKIHNPHFVLESPVYKLIRSLEIKFSSLLENEVWRSIKSFFQLDYQVDISLYLPEAAALHHSKESTNLKPSSCAFSPIDLFGFPDFKINFISFLITQKKNHIWCNKCLWRQ